MHFLLAIPLCQELLATVLIVLTTPIWISTLHLDGRGPRLTLSTVHRRSLQPLAHWHCYCCHLILIRVVGKEQVVEDALARTASPKTNAEQCDALDRAHVGRPLLSASRASAAEHLSPPAILLSRADGYGNSKYARDCARGALQAAGRGNGHARLSTTCVTGH